MTDLENILPLWHELEAAGSDYVLATVVDVDGPSYRKPGARMLIAADGRRAGTVSGGCLEAEVAKRAFWFTESGPQVQRYSTAEDDGDMPYGSGCGGVVYILLERRATAVSLLTALETAFHARLPLAIATILDGADIAKRVFAGPTVPDSGTEITNTNRVPRYFAILPGWRSNGCQSIDQRVRSMGVRHASGSTIAPLGRGSGSSALATMQSRFYAWRANSAGLFPSPMAAVILPLANAFLLQTE